MDILHTLKLLGMYVKGFKKKLRNSSTTKWTTIENIWTHGKQEVLNIRTFKFRND
jgi:hypothetical protein